MEKREQAKALIEHPTVLLKCAYIVLRAGVNRVTDNTPSHLVIPQERP